MLPLTPRAVRRLALARAGLLGERASGLPSRAPADPAGARAAALAVVRRFGYLQLDTLAVSGARSHALVLMSRLDGFPPPLAEELLRPGEPLFEFWGHEASWIPLEDYPLYEFRRRAFRRHPWWGAVVGEHRRVARDLLDRIAREGPLRTEEIGGGADGGGMWALRPEKRVAQALWSRGVLAVRERRGFRRVYDLAERVIPAALREAPVPLPRALEALLLRALGGHGWAEERTLLDTFRLRRAAPAARRALRRLERRGAILRRVLREPGAPDLEGWILPGHLDAAAALERARLPRRPPVLLSPFDPLLWDRDRVERLFGFRYRVGIYTPAARREHGYFVMPVLAGERLPARVDLKADRRAGALRVPCLTVEAGARDGAAAAEAAVRRHAALLRLEPVLPAQSPK